MKPPCEKCGGKDAKRRFFLGKVFCLCTTCALDTSNGLGLVVAPKVRRHPHGTFRDKGGGNATR